MKQEVGGRARIWSVALGVAVVMVAVVYFSSVLATQTILTVGPSNTSNASLLEDRQQILNISINNTDFNQTGAVTGLVITLPSGLVYTTGTQNISTNVNNTFANTTTILNWSNTTTGAFLLNGSVDGRGSIGYVWFNVSATSPGKYNVVVTTLNGTGEANYGNITVNVNDTTNGTARFLYPSNNTGTTSSAFNYSGNFTDNFNLSRVTLYIWNSTTLITPNDTSQVINSTAVNNSDVLANFTFTFPREDRYFFNFLVNDTANNSAFNATNFTIVYDITRPLAEYNNSAGSSEVNYANVSRNWTFVNVTVTETFEVNVTFTLYNTTALVNETTFTDARRTINWTNLPDSIYNYNITVIDLANNRNTTTTRNITVDTTRPLAEFNETGGTSVVLANVSRNWIFVNATVTETNQANITFSLYYTNGTSVNVTTFTSATRTINWTGLGDGRYVYNVTVTDYVNFINTTTSRNITVDTTLPLVEYNTTVPGNTSANYANVSRTWIFVNVTATETNEANITFTLYNGTSSVNVTTFTDARRTINWTNLPDSIYNYNITVIDFANNRNTTTTRNITVDTTRPLAEFNETGGTSVVLANVSRNWIFVNATVTETNQANITFSLYYTNGTSVNVTTFANTSVRTINWTGLGDGRYVYNVTVTDYVNFINTTTSRNITIDTTRPLVEYNTTVPGNTSVNYANVSRTWIFVNVTATETNEANITFTLYNGTSSVNVTTFTTAQRTINWTGLANGNYTYNVTITDYANNRNTTATRTIFIDTAGPSVSLAKTSSTKTSLTLTITSSDAVSGVNPPCNVNRAGALVSGSTVTESSLACSTSYAYDVSCSDFAGNSAVGSLSVSTDSCSGGESASSGGGGGGGSSSTTTTSWTNTFVPEASLVDQGYTKPLGANERVRVAVGIVQHHVGVLEVMATSAKIQVASTPQEATLNVGESKKFEVSNDSIYDLLITLVSITAGKAEITIKAIAEPFTAAAAPSAASPGSTESAQEAASASNGTAAQDSGKQKEARLSTAAWIAGIIIILLVVIALLYRRYR